MRITPIITALTIGSMAAVALAQDMPVEPAADQGKAPSGLSGLADTVDDLSDEPQAGAPASGAPASEAAAAQTPAAPVPGAEVPASEAPAAQAPATPAPGAEASETEAPSPAPNVARPSGPPAPLSAEQRAEIDLAAVRGRQLFDVARAGLLATQDMLSRVADPEAAGISGWVAEPEGNAMAVTFYGDSDSGPVAIYRARVLGGRAVSRETHLTGERPRLAGITQRLARARSASGSEDQRACTQQPFNVIAIPPEAADGPIRVYRISAPESRSKLPLGGHYRSTVAADGTVSEARSFSHGCLNVDVGEVAPGTQAGPIAVTHLLDDLPTEIHVFLSLFSGRPLIVAAGDPTRLFMIAGDSIREMRR